MKRIRTVLLFLTILIVPGPVAAQVTADSAAARATSGFPGLRVAKWSTLTLATAAGIFGFVESARADDRYNELDSLCAEDPLDCQRRAGDGAYVDSQLEALYQTVRKHDRRAHYALIAGQVGVATSVVLFLLDLGNARPPGDIPWVPQELRVERTRDGMSVGFRLPLGRNGGRAVRR
jgi:hypothetical protein